MEKSLNRFSVRFEHSFGFLPTEIHADLQNVYGNGASKYATVCKWVRHFNDGRESIQKDPRVGSAGFHFDGKERCCENIEEDARYTVQEIEELSGIHSSSVLKI